MSENHVGYARIALSTRSGRILNCSEVFTKMPTMLISKFHNDLKKYLGKGLHKTKFVGFVSNQCQVLLKYCCCVGVLRPFETFSGHFGRGQLTYPYCSWASFLGSLHVLSAHSSASN